MSPKLMAVIKENFNIPKIKEFLVNVINNL